MNKKVEKALNEQINKEMFSWYLYTSMSSYFSDLSFDGFANWMMMQALEELSHARKIYEYVIDRGGRAILEQIDKPQAEWDSPMAAFEGAYEHEQYITKSIHDLVDVAVAEDDKATQIFLNWFVEEQVEEEATVSAIVDKFKMMGDFKGGIFMLDRELGARQKGE